MKAIKSKTFHIFFLIILTSLTYINTLQNGFAWDDRDFLLNWPEIKNTDVLPAYLSLPYLLQGDVPLSHRGVYRPVRSVFYLISYNFFGENPPYYHIQSIVIHTLIVLAVYLITLQLTQKKFLSIMVATFFAVHPIHTESVSYITASFDNLGILFFFLSFFFYLKSRLFASILYGSLAFFTYEMTLVLPLLIILYEFCINNFSFRKTLGKINSYKHFILLLVIYVLIRFIFLGIGNRADYLGPVWQIAANQVRITIPEIVANYFSWLTLPVNLTISHNVPINLLTAFLETLGKIDPSGKLVVLSEQIAFLFPIIYATAAISLAFLLLKLFKKSRLHPRGINLAFFGFSWIIISILPVSNIIPQGASLAERFLYIPSFGFVLLLGLLLYFVFKRLPQISFLIFILITGFYFSQTFNRNFDWENEISIWEDAVRVDNTNPLALRALAGSYVRAGEYKRGIEFYRKAIDANVPSAQLNSDMGLAFEKAGDIKKALEQQFIAIEINSNYQPAYTILGNLYLKEKRVEEAEEKYKKALEIIGDDPKTLLYLGNLYFEKREYDKALEVYRQGFELSSDISSTSYEIAYQIGLTYMRQQKFEEAIKVFQKSLALNPNQPEVVEELKKAEEILSRLL